ncbi:hypothetical protein HHX47_DHR1000680 [Lentinula edodes]|nr:hypothetical protein HHX47_DHR1000680 [Lentinula edodes]
MFILCRIGPCTNERLLAIDGSSLLASYRIRQHDRPRYVCLFASHNRRVNLNSGAGVIGDIAVPSERGGFFGFYSLGPMLGPALGPVIGGALSDGLGWRSARIV